MIVLWVDLSFTPINSVFRQALHEGFPAQLVQAAQNLMLNSWAPSTLQTQNSHMNAWYRFCNHYSVDPHTIPEYKLAMFIAHEFSVRGMTAQTIDKRLTTIKTKFQSWFPNSGVADAFRDYYVLKRLIRGGFRLQGGIKVERRLPVTYEILLTFYKSFPRVLTFELLTAKAMLSVALFGMLRASEYIAKWGIFSF